MISHGILKSTFLSLIYSVFVGDLSVAQNRSDYPHYFRAIGFSTMEEIRLFLESILPLLLSLDSVKFEVAVMARGESSISSEDLKERRMPSPAASVILPLISAHS